MTSLVGGLLTVFRGVFQIATVPLRIVAAPFGCLITSIFSVVVFLGILFAIFYLVGLQRAGPSLENDTVTVRGSNGVERTLVLSDEAASLFDVKVQLGQSETGQTVVLVILDEREVNSKLRFLLAQAQRNDPGFPIDSLILVFTPDRATFFINGDAIGRTVGLEVRVVFEIDDQRRVDLKVDRVKLGALPSIPFSRQLADLVLESTPLEDEFEQALPQNVRDIRIEEGRIVIEVSP